MEHSMLRLASLHGGKPIDVSQDCCVGRAQFHESLNGVILHVNRLAAVSRQHLRFSRGADHAVYVEVIGRSPFALRSIVSGIKDLSRGMTPVKVHDGDVIGSGILEYVLETGDTAGTASRKRARDTGASTASSEQRLKVGWRAVR